MRFRVLDEKELIEKAVKGSTAHLDVLLSMYEPFIMENIGKQVKNQQDMLDLRQHVCCKIVSQIAKKNYTHQDKFSNWASRIIKSEVNTYFRRKKKRVVLQYFSSVTLDEYADECLVAAEDTMSLTPNISHYVDQLSAEQAVVIKLKCFKNMTFREISETTGVPINTVMGRYRYGIERIREMIGRS